MKRHISIILSVVLLSLIVLGTGCTLKLDEDTSCRGMGYEAMKACILACDCVNVDNTGDKLLTEYKVAVEGVDYSTPTINFTNNNGVIDFSLSFEVYNDIKVKCIVYIVQDGVILGRTGIINILSYDAGETKNIRFQEDCNIQQIYDPGKEVYYIIDEFIVFKEVK